LDEKSLPVAAQPLSGLRSNSVTDIVIHNDQIWLGTGKGLARSNDGGQTWVTYTTADGLPRGGVSAIAIRDDIIWVATAFDSLTKDAGELTTGGGLAYSLDDGTTWTRIPQPGPTPVQNVTFDIALRNDEVWITSFGGGLQRSFNRGQNLEVVPPDSFFFDPLCNLNHRVFSIINANDALWVGSAGGINKSIDGGAKWTNIPHQKQAMPISGNFVVAIASQNYLDREIIWAATIEVHDSTQQGCQFLQSPGSADQFRGVSISEDGGYSWRTTLPGEFAHNFAFDDSVAYVVTDHGLFKSLDFGRSWVKFPPIIDSVGDQRSLTEEYFAVGVTSDHVLWVGGPDGVASTDDNGITWKIHRGTVTPTQDGQPRTFAYPNPFSPSRHNHIGGDGYVRFRYMTTSPTVLTIKVYNFAMEFVTDVIRGKSIPTPGSYDEIWNGRNARGEIVANGVYFYRLDLTGQGSFWGKIIILD
jgi:photosystem II stability/assembly factor-like uncharacterized protein